jgi:hypothetical protein
LEERGGIENVKTPDVHTFLQHLVTFGIVKKDDVDLYRKLVVGSAWRKQMPKLAVSLGLGDKMPGMFCFIIYFRVLCFAFCFEMFSCCFRFFLSLHLLVCVGEKNIVFCRQSV